jgi:c-di-GMP-binding flagellar brake protein YcgR
MEKRKYKRVPKCLAMKYKTDIHKSEESPEPTAVLSNMSSGGIYFRCKDEPAFEVGQIIEFTMDISSDTTLPEKPACFFFKGCGKVIRIDPPHGYHTFFGVAVEFLTPLGTSQGGKG